MHGGDIYSSKVKYDFSVNVNLLGIPRKAKIAGKKALKNAVHYPDQKCSGLRKALSEKLGIPEDFLCFGNGASELISAFVRASRAKTALLLAPSFSGYKAALDSSEIQAEYYFLDEKNGFAFFGRDKENLKSKILSKKYGILMITTPNNPNGKLISPNYIEEIAQACKKSGTWLLIDECFMALSGRNFSFIKKIGKLKNAAVLRAFTKTFALPGVRLGYIVAQKATAEKVQRELPEWNVSGIAQETGLACLSEEKYLLRAARLIEKERKFLFRKLEDFGFTVFDSDVNFILFKSEKIFDLKERLLEKEILIRDCSDYKGLEKGFYRIAVKSRGENRKLVSALGYVAGAKCVRISNAGIADAHRRRKPEPRNTRPERSEGNALRKNSECSAFRADFSGTNSDFQTLNSLNKSNISNFY